jgi:hypothetical protein
MFRILSTVAVNLMAFLALGSPFFIVSLPYAVAWQAGQEVKR